MTIEEFYEVFENKDTDWKGDNCYQGLQIIAKYTDYLIHGAMHDKIWSEDIEKLIEAGITIEDAQSLRKLTWMMEYECLACFV